MNIGPDTRVLQQPNMHHDMWKWEGLRHFELSPIQPIDV